MLHLKWTAKSFQSNAQSNNSNMMQDVSTRRSLSTAEDNVSKVTLYSAVDKDLTLSAVSYVH